MCKCGTHIRTLNQDCHWRWQAIPVIEWRNGVWHIFALYHLFPPAPFLFFLFFFKVDGHPDQPISNTWRNEEYNTTTVNSFCTRIRCNHIVQSVAWVTPKCTECMTRPQEWNISTLIVAGRGLRVVHHLYEHMENIYSWPNCKCF